MLRYDNAAGDKNYWEFHPFDRNLLASKYGRGLFTLRQFQCLSKSPRGRPGTLLLNANHAWPARHCHVYVRAWQARKGHARRRTETPVPCNKGDLNDGELQSVRPPKCAPTRNVAPQKNPNDPPPRAPAVANQLPGIGASLTGRSQPHLRATGEPNFTAHSETRHKRGKREPNMTSD
jgi:hypothetical protein